MKVQKVPRLWWYDKEGCREERGERVRKPERAVHLAETLLGVARYSRVQVLVSATTQPFPQAA